MKILEERYPIGTIPGQRKPGRYIDGILFENIKILAKNIVRDMTFLGIVTSSTLEVGTGKSVFAQQLCEAYLEAVRQHHNIDNQLSMQNVVFKPKDLIDRAFKVPRYSAVILDEWEDAHYWSELGVSLRQFFRKCRQLNLFMIIIIPNFFQLPASYAISRSVFLIDVRFSGEFDRGYFSFYNFQTKKELYINGKKQQNYNVVKPNFTGRFSDGYVVDEGEYRAAKLRDLAEEEEAPTKKIDIRQIKIDIFKQIRTKLPLRTIDDLANAFGIHRTTAFKWLKEDSLEEMGSSSNVADSYYNLTPEDQDGNEPTEANIERPSKLSLPINN